MKNKNVLAVAVYPLIMIFLIFLGILIRGVSGSYVGTALGLLGMLVAPAVSGYLSENKPIRNAVLGSLVYFVLVVLFGLIPRGTNQGLAAIAFNIVSLPILLVLAVVFGYIGNKLKRN